MKRLILGFILIAVLAAPMVARGSTLAQGCAQVEGGCIHLVDGTNDALWVHTLQAGVWSRGTVGQKCGYYKVGQQNPGGPLNVIHTSAYLCPYIDDTNKWGPIYTQDRDYADGTVFCGWFTAFDPDRKGCVTVHS